MTLIAIACGSPLQSGIVEQIKYLVEKKGADCTINDVNGNSPLHHLAANSVKLAGMRMSLVKKTLVPNDNFLYVKNYIWYLHTLLFCAPSMSWNESFNYQTCQRISKDMVSNFSKMFCFGFQQELTYRYL